GGAVPPVMKPSPIPRPLPCPSNVGEGAQATTLTILCGTTMTFFGGLPASARFTQSKAKTALSTSELAAFRAIVTSPRFLPLIWIGSVMLSSSRRDGSTVGHGCDATRVLCPSADQHS